MKRWFENLNLFHKLMFYFTVIIIFGLLVISIIMYIKTSLSIEKQVTGYLNQNVSNVITQIDDYLAGYEVSTLPLITKDETINFLDRSSNNSYDRFIDYSEIKDTMSELFRERKEIDQIYLMEKNRNFIMAKETSWNLDVNKLYKELYQQTPNSGKVSIIPRMEGEKFKITIARKIRGSKTYNPTGILAIDIAPDHLSRLWNKLNKADNSFFMIIDEDGTTVYHPNEALAGKKVSDDIQRNLNRRNFSFYEDWNNRETFFHFNQSDYTNWKIGFAIPKEILLEPISGIRLTILITGIMTLMLALILAQHFIKKIINPIRLMEKKMVTIVDENWEEVPVPKANDEITSLVKNYNNMVKRLSYLVDKVYRAEIEKNRGKILLQEREIEQKKSEFLALQTQINPHFLYNTLGTINAFSMLNGTDEISEMTESLANMFRYAVQDKEIVTIQEELAHVQDFLTIQQHRWQKEIPLVIEMNEEIYNAKIIKLCLQPIVENAVEHGFSTITENSRISITGEKKENNLIIRIVDNGGGIERDKLKKINAYVKGEGDQKKQQQGIGIKNISRRIRLIFGEEYGLEISSRINKGTEINIILPYI